MTEHEPTLFPLRPGYEYRFGVLNLRETVVMHRALRAMARITAVDAASEVGDGLLMLEGNFGGDLRRQVQDNPDFARQAIEDLSTSPNDDDRVLAGVILLDHHLGLAMYGGADDLDEEAAIWRTLVNHEQSSEVKTWLRDAAMMLTQHIEVMISDGRDDLYPFLDCLNRVAGEWETLNVDDEADAGGAS